MTQAMDHHEVVIIGAGATGSAVACEFASYGVQTLVLEGANGPAAGISGANAGVLRTGLDGTTGSLQSSMILAGAHRWPLLFDELKIPVRTCGGVLIAQDSAQLPALGAIERAAADAGIKVRAYDRGQIRNLEPQAKAVGGLLVPAVAITDPYEMVSRMLGTGATVRYGSQVSAVEPLDGGALVRCDWGDTKARFVINCAGLDADGIAGDDSLTVAALRGEFVVFPEEAAILTDHVIEALPAGPSPQQSAIIFPTIYGALGAAISTGQCGKDDWQQRPQARAEVQAQAAKLIPKLAGFVPADGWTGLGPIATSRGLVAEWSKRVPQMYNLAGIGDDGLTAALGLSAYVLDRARERGLDVKTRTARGARPQEPTFPWWQRRRR
jgi:glycerol-3-phosphate dehydrogenase